VGHENIRPKSIGRELYEGYWSFNDYVRHLGLERSEGVLLRYLSQVYKTLVQNVPETAKNEEVYDIQGFLRALIEATDTSLLQEWESLLHPEWHWESEREQQEDRAELRAQEIFRDPKAFAARVRAEMHQLVRALSQRDFEEAALWIRRPEGEAGERAGTGEVWSAERLEEALSPFLAEYGEVLFSAEARQSRHTLIRPTGPRTWQVRQVLVDRAGDNLWCLEGTVDLTSGQAPEGPLVELSRVGT
jgi:hypothetical protein